MLPIISASLTSCENSRVDFNWKISMGHGRALLGLRQKAKLPAMVDKIIQ